MPEVPAPAARPRTRTLLVAGLTAALVLLAVVVTAALVRRDGGTAPTGPPRYVALGDSYAAGLGAGDYVDEPCGRSRLGYPVLAADRVGADLDLRACSGATVGDVGDDQLAAVTDGTDLVTVTAGGNDAGFTDVLATCARPALGSDCGGALDDARAVIDDVLPGRLDALYAEVTARAPDARLVVVGYPRLFQGEDCNAGTFFSPTEQADLNATADALDQAVAAAADRAGAAFVDVRDAFVGHAVCDSPEWVDGLSDPVRESFHPNVAGYAAYADLVAAALS